MALSLDSPESALPTLQRPAPASEPPPLVEPSRYVGRTIAGRYRLETFIAEGGMGLVFRAHHLVLDQAIALKLVRPDFVHHPIAVARFLDEARAIARLTSPHVAHVFDSGTAEDGTPYMALELLTGSDLRTRLDCAGPLCCEDAARYVVQACRALSEAHALGIVHRDLKPENLFLHRLVDGSFTIKLLDFGISKFLDHPQARSDGRTHTVEGETIGSLHYMSPEQISARGVDARTDIWSLGVVLFELVTGRVPFEGDNVGQVCAAMFAGEAPVLSTLVPDIPREFSEIVDRCLRKAPAERFWHVSELSEALSAFLSREQPLPSSAFSSERPTLISIPPPSEKGLSPRVPMHTTRRARAGLALLGLTAALSAGVALTSRTNLEPFTLSEGTPAAGLNAAAAPESTPFVPIQVEAIASPVPEARVPTLTGAPTSSPPKARAASAGHAQPKPRPTANSYRTTNAMRAAVDELIPPYDDSPGLRAEANDPQR